MSTQPVYIVSATRTPIAKYGGSFKELTPADVSVPAARAAISRAGLLPSHIDETLWGHGRQAGGGPNTARQVAIRAGVPVESPAATLNQACASGMLTMINAWRNIQLGDSSVVLCGGVEVMSRTPYYLMDARWGARMGHKKVIDGMYLDGFHCPLSCEYRLH